jgi:hypothetical protein
VGLVARSHGAGRTRIFSKSPCERAPLADGHFTHPRTGRWLCTRQLAKSRRDYLAQVKMLTVDERTKEAAKINKALGIEAPNGTAAAATLDAARAAYIRLLGSVGSNAEVKAEVTCFCEQLDQMQLRMLEPKPRKRPTTSSPSTYAR